MGRVEHWCQEDSAGLSVSAPFGWRCLTSPGTPRTPAPPHRTGRAVLPHPALRSPSAAGMHGHEPARHGSLAATGGPGHQRGVPASRQSPPPATVSSGVKVRPLPSTEVLLSSICQRYYAPLRLPTRPGSISAAPYTSPLSVPAHPAGPPVVPPGAMLACHPCYPGRPRVTWQPWGSPEHRSSPSGNGVDALTELTRLHLGSLRATACELARVPPDAFVRELGALGYPSHLPRATRARCPLPGPDFHRRVPEYPRHATGHHLGGNYLICLMGDLNSWRLVPRHG